MDIVTALIVVGNAIPAIEGIAEKFYDLVATLKNNNVLTEEQVMQIRADSVIADNEFDTAIAAAKARLGLA